jgi:DNA mismatch repair ATPase MutS
MKAFLMFKDQDFDLQQPSPWHEQDLSKDLELNTLLKAMAMEDEFLLEVTRKAILASLTDCDQILYRQAILKDCLKNSAVIRDIYTVAEAAILDEKKHYLSLFSQYPAAILHRSLEVMQLFLNRLKKLKQIAEAHSQQFESEGFARFFTMLIDELSAEYFASVENHLRQLEFRQGILLSAQLGKGLKGSRFVLHKPKDQKQNWLEWIKQALGRRYDDDTYYISDRDESGIRAYSELKDSGLNLVANALAQANDHILNFFKMLQTELAFYIGCLNLQELLLAKGMLFCFPLPVAASQRRHSFQGLYDICLALTMEQKVVGNALNAESKDLMLITGANQGGKSTFLRSVGQAQLMMQCGMFVPAAAFSANICEGIFTHYKREEDVSMNSGKLDEELNRMNMIANRITPNALLLFNESFAATNEREGSEIAGQITCALVEKRIKVFFVTHLYEFAHSLYRQQRENVLFLRAERQTDGVRTFKISQGEPLQTSFGQDLYNRIFQKSACNSTPTGQ